MTSNELDGFDLRILAALQDQGDLTLSQLAERVHLSGSQCSRRLQALRQAGYVERITALLDPDRLGLGLKAFVSVVLRAHDGELATSFHEFVRRAPEVLECCKLSGDADYLLMVRLRDLNGFNDFLNRVLRGGAVATVRSSIVLENIKSTTALPLTSPYTHR